MQESDIALPAVFAEVNGKVSFSFVIAIAIIRTVQAKIWGCRCGGSYIKVQVQYDTIKKKHLRVHSLHAGGVGMTLSLPKWEGASRW